MSTAHQPTPANRRRAFAARHPVLLACLFELGLGALALVVAWVADWPLYDWSGAPAAWERRGYAVLWGLAATVPMVALFFGLMRFEGPELNAIRQAVDAFVRMLFHRAHVGHLAAVSLAAGVGEELLFRSLIQQGLAALLPGPAGAWAALLLASLAFGLCHWLSTTYGVLASLMGVYFGLLLWLSHDVLAPIIAHALYDFVALHYVWRAQQCGQDAASERA